MRGRAEREKHYRRVFAAALVASLGIHGAILALGKLGVPGLSEAPKLSWLTPHAVKLVSERPMEVIRIRPASTARDASSAELQALAALPARSQVSAALGAMVSAPRMFLQVVTPRTPKSSQEVVTAYVSAEEMLMNANPNGRTLRKTDERPIGVLAGLGLARRRGGGLVINGGGHGACGPAPGGPVITRIPGGLSL